MPLLVTGNLTRSFGGVRAVSGVSVSVPAGQLRGVMGANGAGKSTFFNLICGDLMPDEGTITFRGQRIERLPPVDRARLRIGTVFQDARLSGGMTVLENLAPRLPRQRAEERRIRSQAEEAIERTGLRDWADRPAGSLPLGQQRSLQVARALCGDPELLLLDEPASGLLAGERDGLAVLLAALKQTGLTIMLIEHDVEFVASLADVVTVLDLGMVIAEGPPDQALRDPAVITAYIGEEGPGA
jgi:branched-chain amino acid transport system ATP-binding protein